MEKKIVLFKRNFVELVYDTEHSVFEETFTTDTEHTEWPEIQAYWAKMAQWFKEYRPKYNLTNAKDFLFAINTDNQEWINEYVASEAQKVLVRKAMVMSADFLSQLSIQLTLEENIASQIPIKYFETRDEAFHWLING